MVGLEQSSVDSLRRAVMIVLFYNTLVRPGQETVARAGHVVADATVDELNI